VRRLAPIERSSVLGMTVFLVGVNLV